MARTFQQDEFGEGEYFDRIIPPEGRELFDRTIAESPTWELMGPEQRMDMADTYANSIVSGDISEAEDWLFLLQVEWDDDDIRDFYEAYEMLTSG